MKPQSFTNHTRVHPVYHYFAIPASLALVVAATVNVVFEVSLTSVVLLIGMVILHLAIFLSRHYAKRNQDRIIRLELRLRYYLLTGHRLEDMESQFSNGQLFALRFASDREFIDLVKSAGIKQMTSEEIKRAIVSWNADLMRV